MKKISFLLIAIIIAGSLSAQIESFSESEILMSTPSKPVFVYNKLDYLPPFEGSLSPFGRKYHESTVINVIGEQLYCQTQANISSTQFYYVLVKDQNGLALSKIQQGKYYTVKDILISKEEISRLQEEFNNLPFRSDTLYYTEVDSRGVAQLLDKTQLPKKAKKFIIPQEYVFKIFFKEYMEWPRQDDLRKNQQITTAIYILVDSEGNEYYFPKYDTFELKPIKWSWPNSIEFHPGKLADISGFITVKGFNNVKKKFENQLITYNHHDECETRGKIVLCKKIALKDGQVMAAITDTLSTTILYRRIYDGRKRGLTWCNKRDSLMFITIKGYGDNCTVHDIDSVEAKIAYEKLIEEQEKLRKDERKKQELIKKYGSKIGQSIAEGKACVGMDMEQCKEAMGTPNNISRNTSNLGAIEVWTYSLGYQMYGGLIPISVVTFLNNKVTSVEEYSNWP